MVYHKIFVGKSWRSAGFREEKIAKDFSAGLKHLKDTGRFAQIYAKYAMAD